MHHPWSILRKEICFLRNYAQCYNILKSFKLKTFRCTCHLNLNSFYGRVDYNILLKVINSYVCRCMCYALSKENVIYEKQKVFMSTCFNFYKQMVIKKGSSVISVKYLNFLYMWYRTISSVCFRKFVNTYHKMSIYN